MKDVFGGSDSSSQQSSEGGFQKLPPEIKQAFIVDQGRLGHGIRADQGRGSDRAETSGGGRLAGIVLYEL